jgi:hypothetical protein
METGWLRDQRVADRGKSCSAQNVTRCIVSYPATYLRDLRGKRIHKHEQIFDDDWIRQLLYLFGYLMILYQHLES